MIFGRYSEAGAVPAAAPSASTEPREENGRRVKVVPAAPQQTT
jgi:hypothetical protein